MTTTRTHQKARKCVLAKYPNAKSYRYIVPALDTQYWEIHVGNEWVALGRGGTQREAWVNAAKTLDAAKRIKE